MQTSYKMRYFLSPKFKISFWSQLSNWHFPEGGGWSEGTDCSPNCFSEAPAAWERPAAARATKTILTCCHFAKSAKEQTTKKMLQLNTVSIVTGQDWLIRIVSIPRFLCSANYINVINWMALIIDDNGINTEHQKIAWLRIWRIAWFKEGWRYQIGWIFGKIPNGLQPPPLILKNYITICFWKTSKKKPF